MPFDPARDGWRLREAIMRLSDPAALATLARLCAVAADKDGRPRLPIWWLEGIASVRVDDDEPDVADLYRRSYEVTFLIQG